MFFKRLQQLCQRGTKQGRDNRAKPLIMRFKFSNTKILFFAFVFTGITVFSFAFAKEFDVKGVTPAATPIPVTAEKIASGIKLLKDSPPLLYETTKKNLAGDLVRKQIALAIFDTNTGEIFQKRVWVKETDIKNSKKIGIVPVVPALPDEALDIHVSWWNSFNSVFEVTNHPELIIIADKYFFPSTDLATLPEKTKNKYTDIVYVPYSDALHLPNIIAAGKNYLETKLDKAYSDLEVKGVLSRSTPGTLVTTDVSKDFVRNILLVEHVDPAGFNMATDNGLELTERVLALIGANQELAYRYTGSPAGASGMAQFIRASYLATVAAYPKAQLIRDFRLGMADHVNAIEAMVLYFDSRKQELNNRVIRKDILNSLGITEEMLAAAYNGGGAKVASSVNKFGMAWMSGQLNLPSSRALFKRETINYVLKFQAIKSLNLFASIDI
jgi:hypothetical protein